MLPLGCWHTQKRPGWTSYSQQVDYSPRLCRSSLRQQAIYKAIIRTIITHCKYTLLSRRTISEKRTPVLTNMVPQTFLEQLEMQALVSLITDLWSDAPFLV